MPKPEMRSKETLPKTPDPSSLHQEVIEPATEIIEQTKQKENVRRKKTSRSKGDKGAK